MTEATDTPTSEVVKSPNGDTKPDATKDDKANGAEVVKDDNIGKTTVELKSFTRIKEKKHYTEPFEVCGLKWYASCEFIVNIHE